MLLYFVPIEKYACISSLMTLIMFPCLIFKILLLHCLTLLELQHFRKYLFESKVLEGGAKEERRYRRPQLT